MAEAPLASLWTAIDRLTERERGAVRRELARTPEERLVLAALNGPNFRPPACPHCGDPRLQRWGMAGGLQRYRCTSCGRTCNPLTGTPLARLRRRDLWLGHAEALDRGMSLRTAARLLGVHQHTTFRWRHRWLVQPAGLQAPVLGGIVEIAAVPFHDTGEGWATGRRVAIAAGALAARADDRRPEQPSRPPRVQALLLRDRSGGRADALLRRLEAPAIADIVGPLVRAEPVVLCSDGRPVFAAAASALGAAHRPSGGATAATAPVDLTILRGCIDRLAAWMVRFRGVSTRYLAHYLGWRRALERQPAHAGLLTWLHLAHGALPTANVGNDDRTTAAARSGWRAGGAAALSVARRPGRGRAAAACRARSTRAADAVP